MTERSFATGHTQSSDQGGYSRLSRLLHWSVATGFLGALAIGLLLDWLPREARGVWLDPHRALGLGVLAFGAWRLMRRVRIGFPAPEASQPRWQALAARATHWALLAATLAMPLSGVLMTVARGRAVELWGLTVIPAWGEISWLAAAAGTLHEAALPVLAGLRRAASRRGPEASLRRSRRHAAPDVGKRRRAPRRHRAPSTRL